MGLEDVALVGDFDGTMVGGITVGIVVVGMKVGLQDGKGAAVGGNTIEEEYVIVTIPSPGPVAIEYTGEVHTVILQ